MCNVPPAVLAMSGLSIMSSAGAISAQNEQSVANAANAKQTMNDETVSTTRSFLEQNRSLIQSGFDAVLEGRADEAIAFTSAIENGAQGASVKAALRDHRQKTNRSVSRTRQEQDSLRDQTGANLKHIRSKAQGRIGSIPTTKFGLGDAASAAAPIVDYLQD